MERFVGLLLDLFPMLTSLSVQYIALERLESIYKACNLVGNICVHATQEAKQPMAVIIPHEAHLRQFLDVKGIDSSQQLDTLCHDPKVKEIVLKECNAVGKKNGFKPTELLQAVILTAEEWTPENGLVTAAQKIQRAKIAKMFRDDIEVGFFADAVSAVDLTCLDIQQVYKNQ